MQFFQRMIEVISHILNSNVFFDMVPSIKNIDLVLLSILIKQGVSGKIGQIT